MVDLYSRDVYQPPEPTYPPTFYGLAAHQASTTTSTPVSTPVGSFGDRQFLLILAFFGILVFLAFIFAITWSNKNKEQ